MFFFRYYWRNPCQFVSGFFKEPVPRTLAWLGRVVSAGNTDRSDVPMPHVASAGAVLGWPILLPTLGFGGVVVVLRFERRGASCYDQV